MIFRMAVYLFKYRLLSQLRNILQVTDRSVVRRSSPSFQSSVSNPDSSDKLIIFVTIGKSTSIQSITRDVGIGSKVQLFFALLLISLRASSSEKRLNLLSVAGDTEVWSSERDGSPCAMLSSLEPMVSQFSKQRKFPFDSPVERYYAQTGRQPCCPPSWRASSMLKRDCADCCDYPQWTPDGICIEVYSLKHYHCSFLLYTVVYHP